MNWRARPLTSLEVVVNLISATRTKTGLKIKNAIGKKISDKDMEANNIKYNDEQVKKWDYQIVPVVKINLPVSHVNI